MTRPDPEDVARALAGESLAAGDPTGWFERLYAAADRDATTVPWDRGEPYALVADWARERRLTGAGRRAVVVGCGHGFDAELVAGAGFDTVAFDVAPSAVAAARRRHPDSLVDYQVADLLDLPVEWRQAFDLVVECRTVQSMPVSVRARATRSVADLVGPGGTLLVVAAARDEDAADHGPPWPLTRPEVEAFADGGLEPVRIEDLRDPDPTVRRWRAEFRR
jgi:SAM-dependent methyltransferase